MRTSLATKTMKSKFSILTTAVAAILLSLPLGTIAKEPEHADAPKVSPADAPAHINSLVTAIQPAVEATRGADVEATVKANIDNVVEGLRSSEPVLKKEVETGAINVVGAYYNLDTAAVSFTEKKKE